MPRSIPEPAEAHIESNLRSSEDPLENSYRPFQPQIQS